MRHSDDRSRASGSITEEISKSCLGIVKKDSTLWITGPNSDGISMKDAVIFPMPNMIKPDMLNKIYQKSIASGLLR